MKFIDYQTELKPLDADVLKQIYQGQIIKSHSTSASMLLAQHALSIVQTSLQTEYPASLHEIWPPRKLHHSFGCVRRIITEDQTLRQHYRQLLESLGLDITQWRVDMPRLRTVSPGSEQIPAAAAAYYAHRDTWYANPARQINLWIPLANYPAQQTFIFWPELIDSRVINNSAEFNYEQWQRQTGFQNPRPPQDAVYPRALQLPELEAHGFECQIGDLLLFAAAQLHQTLPNPGPQIRFSLDLRLVPLYIETAALDPDNDSQGSTLSDYQYFQTITA